MKPGVLRVAAAVVLAGGLAVGTGCAGLRSPARDLVVNTPKPQEADPELNGLRWLGTTVGDDIAGCALLKNAPSKPILVVMGIQNRTPRRLDLKTLTDALCAVLANSGKADLASESVRDALLQEQGCQLSNCPPETRVQIGKRLGARYMLTGWLIEIRRQMSFPFRVSKQEEACYQLTVEITDLQTSQIAWMTHEERRRGE